MQLIRLIRFVWSHPLNRAARLRALSRVFRWQFASRLLPEAIFGLPFVNDSRLFAKKGMTGATGNWYCGLDEMDDMGFVLHVLREGDLFVDVGANIGSYSVLAASACDAQVIAIEPILSTFSSLCANVKLNGLECQIKTFRVGLSNCSGKLRFTTSQNTVNHVLADGEQATSEEIEVTTLDSLLRGGRPALIKIDVEGHELAVLEGSEKTLSSPDLLAVVMETNGSGKRYGISDQRLIEVMARHGFEMWSYSAAGRLLKPITDSRKRHGNTIFLRNTSEIERRIGLAQNTRLVNGRI